MIARTLLMLGAFTLAFGPSARTPAKEMPDPYVRIAEIEVDPAQLETYQAAVKEQIEAAIRLEPGVLALYAVAEKDHPTRVKVFEIYADVAAYQAHLETAHFKRYKTATQAMVRSLRLIDTFPIALGAKAG